MSQRIQFTAHGGPEALQLVEYHAAEPGPDELFAMLGSGQLRGEIGQRFALRDAAVAQQALSNRQTTGSSILLP